MSNVALARAKRALRRETGAVLRQLTGGDVLEQCACVAYSQEDHRCACRASGVLQCKLCMHLR